MHILAAEVCTFYLPNRRLLVEAGYYSVEKIADADYRAMYERLAAVNSAKSYYRGRLTERDIWLFIRYAKDVPLHIPAQIVHRFRGKSSTHSD